MAVDGASGFTRDRHRGRGAMAFRPSRLTPPTPEPAVIAPRAAVGLHPVGQPLLAAVGTHALHDGENAAVAVGGLVDPGGDAPNDGCSSRRNDWCNRA